MNAGKRQQLSQMVKKANRQVHKTMLPRHEGKW
jgi:hypothetical protein